MNLYELTNFEAQLIQMLEEGEEVADTLEAIESSVEEKLESYAKVIRTFEARATVKQLEIKRLQDSARTDEEAVKRMKRAMQDYLEGTGKRKVETPLFKVWMQKNPASVEVVDESLVPKEFYKIPEPQLDKTALKNALKESEVPGVQLKQTESIRMK